MKFLYLLVALSVASPAYAQFPPGYRLGLMPGGFYYDYGYDYGYREVPPPMTAAERYAAKIETMNAKNRYDNRVLDLGVARANKKLENSKQWAAIKDKEDFYRKKGYLPPKPTPKYLAYGKTYNSFAEFKLSPDYPKMVAEGEAREAERNKKAAQDKLRYQAAVLASREWQGMSEEKQASQVNKNKVIESLRFDIISGRYSETRIEKMMHLLESLEK